MTALKRGLRFKVNILNEGELVQNQNLQPHDFDAFLHLFFILGHTPMPPLSPTSTKRCMLQLKLYLFQKTRGEEKLIKRQKTVKTTSMFAKTRTPA